MRIAIYHNLPSGGAKRAVFEWTRRLASEHTIDVYSLETADHAFCDIRSLVSQYKIFDFTARRLFETPFGRLNQFQRWRDLYDLERTNRQIAMQINDSKYDVIFVHPCLYTFIPALLQYIEIPSIYYLHEPFGLGFIRHIQRPYLPKKGWQEWLNRVDPLISLYQRRLVSMQERSLFKTSGLLANSQFTSNCIKATFGADAAFCPLGVDLDSFQPCDNSVREDFVFSVGEMSPRKGFDFIVRSLGKIPAGKRPALKLACNVVDDNELRFIKNLAIDNGVDLEVLTRRGTLELKHLYNRARLCVYAAVMEPFGLVPLEAMACGTPVVAADEGGVRESVVDGVTGRLVARDTSKFADAILSLLENPILCRLYGTQAHQHVLENWTWEKAVESLQQHMHRIVLRLETSTVRGPYQLTVTLFLFAMRRLLPFWYMNWWHVNWVLHNVRR